MEHSVCVERSQTGYCCRLKITRRKVSEVRNEFFVASLKLVRFILFIYL
jgi:hypothetical protein